MDINQEELGEQSNIFFENGCRDVLEFAKDVFCSKYKPTRTNFEGKFQSEICFCYYLYLMFNYVISVLPILKTRWSSSFKPLHLICRRITFNLAGN
jgi:hypothetical protein